MPEEFFQSDERVSAMQVGGNDQGLKKIPLVALAWGPFLESPETLPAIFRCHNSLCISRTFEKRAPGVAIAWGRSVQISCQTSFGLPS